MKLNAIMFISKLQTLDYFDYRYEYGGCPLHLTAPSTHPVPPCTYCGQPRVFELQFMPTLVSLLKIQHQEGTCLSNCLESHIYFSYITEEYRGDYASI